MYRAPILAGWVAVCAFGFPARAEVKPALKALFEIKLDIDRDGKMDRAVLVGPPESEARGGDQFMLNSDEHVDLYIYLAVEDEKIDLSRKPAFLKKEIVKSGWFFCVYPLESKGNGSLIVSTDVCGGRDGYAENARTTILPAWLDCIARLP